MKCYIHTETNAMGTCVDCGKPICESCNREIKDKYYCKNCIEMKLEKKPEGNVLKGDYEQYYSTKNKYIAALLGIFIGGLGIHKFYLGRIMSGIVYILFCWTGIPSIIGFIEGIVYLCTDDKDFSKKYEQKR